MAGMKGEVAPTTAVLIAFPDSVKLDGACGVVGASTQLGHEDKYTASTYSDGSRSPLNSGPSLHDRGNGTDGIVSLLTDSSQDSRYRQPRTFIGTASAKSIIKPDRHCQGLWGCCSLEVGNALYIECRRCVLHARGVSVSRPTRENASTLHQKSKLVRHGEPHICLVSPA